MLGMHHNSMYKVRVFRVKTYHLTPIINGDLDLHDFCLLDNTITNENDLFMEVVESKYFDVVDSKYFKPP
jgi:hypothetical protein